MSRRRGAAGRERRMHEVRYDEKKERNKMSLPKHGVDNRDLKIVNVVCVNANVSNVENVRCILT